MNIQLKYPFILSYQLSLVPSTREHNVRMLVAEVPCHKAGCRPQVSLAYRLTLQREKQERTSDHEYLGSARFNLNFCHYSTYLGCESSGIQGATFGFLKLEQQVPTVPMLTRVHLVKSYFYFTQSRLDQCNQRQFD